MSYFSNSNHNTDNLCYVLGPNYIRVNQSAVQRYNKRKRIINKEHKDLFNPVQNYLSSRHHVIPTAPIYKIYSENLKHQLDLRYMASLSISDGIRAHREKDIVKSICAKLKQHKLLIRVTDKSGIFCILQYKDHEQKAMEYREKTKAYKELSLNPFQETLNKVVRLLNDLHAKQKKVRAWQYNRMQVGLKKSKLAYMYFNPKTHKVIEQLHSLLKFHESKISQLYNYLPFGIYRMVHHFDQS